jgi:hypothetical protein
MAHTDRRNELVCGGDLEADLTLRQRVQSASCPWPKDTLVGIGRRMPGF